MENLIKLALKTNRKVLVSKGKICGIVKDDYLKDKEVNPLFNSSNGEKK